MGFYIQAEGENLSSERLRKKIFSKLKDLKLQ